MSRMRPLFVASVVAGLALANNAQAIIVLDDFSISQSNSTAGTPSSNVPGPAANIFGGNGRTQTVGLVSGAGDISSRINTLSPNTLVFSSDFGADGFVQLDYTSAPTDITPGANGLSGQLAGDLGGANFVLTINSLGGGTSTSSVNIPGGAAFSPFSIPFASLVGTVDLTQVTGVTLRLNGASSFDGALRLLQFDVPPSDVPEPGAVALLVGAAGMGGAMLRRRRK